MSTPDTIRDFAADLRPDRWGDICGQPSIVRTLKAWCISGKPPKALLFIGPYGCGKSTLARLTAMAMSCSGRSDDDPNPCGKCGSCQMFIGRFGSMNSTILPPDANIIDFRRAVEDVQSFYAASMYSDVRRPAPLYLDDLDEVPLANQRHLKRALDKYWNGFIISATTKVKKVEPGLLHRFHQLHVQRIEMGDLVPWIVGTAKRVGMGDIPQESAAIVARAAGMNPRNVLKLLQAIAVDGKDITVENVQRTALAFAIEG